MYNNKHQKIPLLQSIIAWQDVEIRESGEKLVSLNNLYPDRIIVEPQYFLQGIEGAMKESFVRETVAEMLIKASKLLPKSYKYVIWDAWRPIETQRSIFNSYKRKLKELNPAFNEEKLINLAQKYVSLPSLEKKSPPPHSTGGAIDLSIVDKSGNYLDMGTPFDDFSNKASIRYFEEKMEREKSLSNKEIIILNNRRLLFYTQIEVGFTNYPEEWWHYDYGNQFWAKTKGVSAKYGRISLKDLNKKI